MIRRPPRSTLDRSSAASDVYKRQLEFFAEQHVQVKVISGDNARSVGAVTTLLGVVGGSDPIDARTPVSYTHLRAHETVLDLVCRLLLEKKKQTLHEHTLYYD